jgi:hypothetical protein
VDKRKASAINNSNNNDNNSNNNNNNNNSSINNNNRNVLQEEEEEKDDYDGDDTAMATYNVELAVTGSNLVKDVPTTTTVVVNHYVYKPKSTGSIRIGHFNSGFADGAKNTEGELAKLLKDPTWEYAKKIADVIQKNKPDMLRLQEFDHLSSPGTKGLLGGAPNVGFPRYPSSCTTTHPKSKILRHRISTPPPSKNSLHRATNSAQ